MFADFNGDGHPDMVNAGVLGNVPLVRAGRGDGTFGAALRLPRPSKDSAAVADFNLDGRLDLAFIHDAFRGAGRVEVFLNWTGLSAPPCVVHWFAHRRLRTVRRDLRSSGCRLGAVRYRTASTTRRDHVISQGTPNGSVLPHATAVDLTVSRGRRGCKRCRMLPR